MLHLCACEELGVALVLGTTGFEPAQLALIEAFGESNRLVLPQI